MKNIKLVALAAALVLGAPLASCGNGGSTTSSTTSSEPPVVKNWSEAEQALMREKVGEVLPYIEVAGEWAWDEGYGMLSFVSSGVGAKSQTLEYARSLAKGGFALDSDGYGDVVATKTMSNGVLNVNEYLIDFSEDDTTEDIRFMIDAWIEVPTTAWTSEEKSEMAKLEEGFELPFMYFFGGSEVEYDDEYEALALIAMYRSSYDAAYAKAAEDAGWVVSFEEGMCSAMKLTEKGNIGNLQWGEFSGYFYLEATITPVLTAWPADQIAAFLADATPSITETCLAPVGGTKFLFDGETYVSDYNCVRVDILDAVEGEAEAYKTALTTAGYTVEDPAEGEVFYNATSENGDGRIMIEFAQSGSAMTVYVTRLEPIEDTWPADKIESYLMVQGCDTAIPAVSGPTKFVTNVFESQVTTYDYRFVVDVTIKDPSATQVSSYSEALTTAGFTVAPVDDYYRATKDRVTMFFGMEGTNMFVQIHVLPIQKASAYPTDATENWLEAQGISTVFVAPSMSSVSYWFVNSELEIVCAGADAGTPGVNAIEDTYCVALTEAGWEIDDSEYDTTGYIATSPDGRVTVTFYSYNGSFVLYASVVRVL